MRLSVPASLIGTLGALVQRLIGTINALVVIDWGVPYASSFGSSTNLGAGATEQVFSAASNANGAIVWQAEITTGNPTTNGDASLHAKATAPTTSIDGDLLMTNVLLGYTTVGFIGATRAKDLPIFIAAGKGLFFRNNSGTAESASRRSVLYTLF